MDRDPFARTMDPFAVLQAHARRAAFGQDTSRLHEREAGLKAWRAEHPATDEAKAAGVRAEKRIQALLPLAALNLDKLNGGHMALLAAQAGLANPLSNRWHRCARELALALGARQARSNLNIPALYDGKLALPYADFITTVRGGEHGERTKLTKPPRIQPWPVGSVKGETYACARILGGSALVL